MTRRTETWVRDGRKAMINVDVLVSYALLAEMIAELGFVREVGR